MAAAADHPRAEAERLFVSQVREFLRAHWPQRRWYSPRQREADRERFLAALARRGWLVPHWPVAAGGADWPPRRQYLLAREIARVGAPEPDPVTVGIAGPLLIRFGAGRWDRHLELIRTGAERWCAHASVLGGVMPGLTREPAGWRLDRSTMRAFGASRAHWLLLLAGGTGGPRLLAVPLAARQVTPGLPLDPDLVTLDDGWLHGAVPIGDAGEGRVLLAQLEAERAGQPCAPASRLAFQLASLAASLTPGPATGADGALPAGQLASLGVELLGLEALEARANAYQADANPAAAERGAALRAALRIRASAFGTRLAELAVAAAGYYAMPAPEPLTLDNEGPIGDVRAQDAMADLIGYVGGPGDGADREIIMALTQTREDQSAG